MLLVGDVIRLVAPAGFTVSAISVRKGQWGPCLGFSYALSMVKPWGATRDMGLGRRTLTK